MKSGQNEKLDAHLAVLLILTLAITLTNFIHSEGIITGYQTAENETKATVNETLEIPETVETVEEQTPEIVLTYPEFFEVFKGNKTGMTFEYELSNADLVTGCELYERRVDTLDQISYVLVHVADVPADEGRNTFYRNITAGKFVWQIICGDGNETYESEQHKYILDANETKQKGLARKGPKAEHFDRTLTTDFNGMDEESMKDVKDMSLGISRKGKISYRIDQDDQGIDVTDLDLDDAVEIGKNFIKVDSKKAPKLNRKARLTIYEVQYEHPYPYMDGEPCPPDVCSDYTQIGDRFTFTVEHFTNYSTGPNTRLEIWDQNDSGMDYGDTAAVSGEQIRLFANYSNITSGATVTGADCNISFNDSYWAMMSYNATNGLYEHNRTFTAGDYRWNVTCNKTDYETLNATDYLNVSEACIDSDGDGFGDASSPDISACTYTYAYDCDDTDTNVLPPYEDMTLTKHTTLCNGTYTLDDTGDDGCIILSSNASLTCQGTRIVGAGTGYGYGFYMANVDNVNITGCNATNYRRGFYGTSSSNITLRNNSAGFSRWGMQMLNVGPLILNDSYIYHNTNYGVLFIQSATNAEVNGLRVTNSSNALSIEFYATANVTNMTSWNNAYGTSMNAGTGSIIRNSTFYSNNYGIYIMNFNDSLIENNVLWNNSYGSIYITSDSARTFNMTRADLLNNEGTGENHSVLSIYDNIGSETRLINWTTEPAAPPGVYTSFRNKHVKIEATGSGSIDTATWHWNESEVTAEYDETGFEVWVYNKSGWTMLNNTPDTTANELRVNSLEPSSTYSILQSDAWEPNVTLVSPADNFNTTDTNTTFVCNATDLNLTNITLYTNVSGAWQKNQSEDVTGTENQSEFNITGISHGNYAWNCEAYDSAGNSAYAAANRSFQIQASGDTGPPVLRNLVPAKSATGVDKDTGISFDITDDSAGVNASSISIFVEGTDMTSSAVITTNNATNVSVTLSASLFTFSYSQVVDVDVTVSDNASKQLTDSYSFTIEAEPTESTTSSGGGGGGGSGICVTDWQCTNWSNCIGNKRTRTCTDMGNCGNPTASPATEMSCSCITEWDCTDWGECMDGLQYRTCELVSLCEEKAYYEPREVMPCWQDVVAEEEPGKEEAATEPPMVQLPEISLEEEFEAEPIAEMPARIIGVILKYLWIIPFIALALLSGYVFKRYQDWRVFIAAKEKKELDTAYKAALEEDKARKTAKRKAAKKRLMETPVAPVIKAAEKVSETIKPSLKKIGAKLNDENIDNQLAKIKTKISSLKRKK